MLLAKLRSRHFGLALVLLVVSIDAIPSSQRVSANAATPEAAPVAQLPVVQRLPDGQPASGQKSFIDELTAETNLARVRFRVAADNRQIYSDPTGYTVTLQQIRGFLEARRSPLAPFSEEILLAANNHDIDPRLVVAIAGVESQFGKKCRGFNAWGWNNGKTRWNSWSDSIDAYSRLLVTRYPDWRNLRRVAPVYNPNTPGAWGTKVANLMSSIVRAT